MTIPPFEPALRDGKVWGRGSTDTKGPMAAALWALREWAQSDERGRSRVHWTFLALMGEEAGNDGAWAVANRGFACDLALVLEPSDLKVLATHKGIVWMEVHTSGVACHGSTPEKGRSAIYAMRRALQIVEEKIIPGLARHTHPQLGAATLNVGTISGGSKINIVPDACRIELDCRIVPGLEPETLRAQIEETLRRELPDVEVRMQRHGPALSTDEKLPWVARLATTARGFAAGPFFSDAAVLGRPDCPAVCIGPGQIAQAHTKDEFIEVRDLEAGADFFRRWIETAEVAAA
jgi:acetylornithine deacetylase/succinyl-diaminopimelate desuccinylase-like protein